MPEGSQKNVRYIVNFPPEIQEMISEANYLVLLDYTVPQLIQHVALQEDQLLG